MHTVSQTSFTYFFVMKIQIKSLLSIVLVCSWLDVAVCGVFDAFVVRHVIIILFTVKILKIGTP